MVSRLSNCHIATLRTLWNMQDIVHIGHNDKPGTNFFYDIVVWSIRHVITISSNGTTQTTNTTRCAPSCVSSQCQNN